MQETQIVKQIAASHQKVGNKARKTKESALKFLIDAGIIKTKLS